MKEIYLVLSKRNTKIGKLIRLRANINFLGYYEGQEYSHASLSLDDKLDNMYSFAREETHSLKSSLIKEDIKTGIFKLSRDQNMVVFKIPVEKKQYDEVSSNVEEYWLKRDTLKFNVPSLVKMLFCGMGLKIDKHYTCSEWISTVLDKSGVKIFDPQTPKEVKRRMPHNVRPFDYYTTLKNNIVYEGKIGGYTPSSSSEANINKKTLTNELRSGNVHKVAEVSG